VAVQPPLTRCTAPSTSSTLQHGLEAGAAQVDVRLERRRWTSAGAADSVPSTWRTCSSLGKPSEAK
jgi:hypothetical protein